MANLEAFLTESNRIEGITGFSSAELACLEAVLAAPALTIENICSFVGATQPDAVLREEVGMDVCVGAYYPPRGGPAIKPELVELLTAINLRTLTPYGAHRRYESLHPFTDGNGRSGRMIWLWQMLREGRSVRLGFLHHFYYQALAATE